ncbi:hypothetical protein [Burkholderia ubonensis]|uniref:hypothetical protein n=1 Tax=Burkholderia ubonensis TaxID=101571 RepID=UPI00076D15AC|nr:hypothetical protein [Burkholderia ubonensis]KVO43844.1 hypothetical protein WJ75_00760 [Burkholderia ubonensis]
MTQRRFPDLFEHSERLLFDLAQAGVKAEHVAPHEVNRRTVDTLWLSMALYIEVDEDGKVGLWQSKPDVNDGAFHSTSSWKINPAFESPRIAGAIALWLGPVVG